MSQLDNLMREEMLKKLSEYHIEQVKKDSSSKTIQELNIYLNKKIPQVIKRLIKKREL